MKKSTKILLYIVSILCCAFVVMRCGKQKLKDNFNAVRPLISQLQQENKLDSCRQLIVVVCDSLHTSQATMYLLERSQDATAESVLQKDTLWQMAMPTLQVAVGQKGMIEAEKKCEGDKCTPTGLYSLPFAFGPKKDRDIKMPFVEVSDKHIWISESTDSLYNQLYVDSFDVYKGKDIERLIDYPIAYQYAVVIDYNAACVPYAGSAIFMHCLKPDATSTAGCVAMPTEKLIPILEWLDSEKHPMIYMDILNK